MTRRARTSMENCVPRTRQQWLREKWKGRSRLSRLACVSRPSVSPKKSAANSFTHLRDAHTSHPLRNADIYNVPVTNNAYKNAKKMSSVKVFTDNGFSASIPVDNSTTAASLCLEIAVYIDNLRDITDWCLFEHICDGKLERLIEDHEKIKAVQESWEQRLGGYLVFRKNLHKHDPVLYPERAFASHITNNEDTEAGITGVAKQAKLFLIRDYILSSKKMPDLQNQLYLHQGSQNSGWKKYLTCLRGSGMYYTPHRKLKNPKHLHCFSRLDDVSVYTVLKSHNQLKCPTKFCLGLKPKSSLKSDFKGLKYLATKDEDMLQKWSLALRLAKFGDQLEENFRMAVRRQQRVDQLTKKC